MAKRKVGVEEELMLVDPGSGALKPVSRQALAANRDHAIADDGAKAGLEQELFLEQIETGTTPCRDISDLLADLQRCRQAAAAAADAVGAGLVAVGTPVITEVDQQLTPKPRYQRIVDQFGEIGRQGSVCGMHLHVDVRDDEEGITVIDALRPWLPVLRALSVNSPFWQGQDSGYASWRSQVWGRWPTAGPSNPFGDVAGYRRAAQALITSGAALDRGMLYFDARLAVAYPTVEIRVFDVMTELDDIVFVAALTRALVDTVLETADQEPWRTDLLRAAHWRASRDGMSRHLLDPQTQAPQPARDVVASMVDHCRAALDATGDTNLVEDGLERLLARGTGASRQRAVFESGRSMQAVVADLQERFRGSWS